MHCPVSKQDGHKKNRTLDSEDKKQQTENKKLFYNFYFFLLTNLNEIHKKYLIDSILNALRFPCSQTINYSLLFQELMLFCAVL